MQSSETRMAYEVPGAVISQSTLFIRCLSAFWTIAIEIKGITLVNY